MQFDPKHPVAYGMPEEAPGVFTSSPAFRLNPTFEGKTPETIAKYPGGSLLMSGYLKGEQLIQNTVAAADVPLGKGRVILLGFGVEQRGAAARHVQAAVQLALLRRVHGDGGRDAGGGQDDRGRRTVKQ